MSDEPTLMFCIGATKAGTSWLHRYISNHPESHMRGIKELHYFDALEFDDWDPWIKMVTDRRDNNLADASAIEGSDAAMAAKNDVSQKMPMIGGRCFLVVPKMMMAIWRIFVKAVIAKNWWLILRRPMDCFQKAA